MTVILTIVGIQLIFVLKEFSKLVKRVNRITDELEKIGVNIGHGAGEIVGFISGIKNFVGIVDILAKRKEKKHDKK